MFKLDNLEKAFGPAVEYSVQVVEGIDIGRDVEDGEGYGVGSTEGLIYVYNEVARVKSKEGVIARIVEACNLKEQFENYNCIEEEDSFCVEGYFERNEWQDIVRIVPIYVG